MRTIPERINTLFPSTPGRARSMTNEPHASPWINTFAQSVFLVSVKSHKVPLKRAFSRGNCGQHFANNKIKFTRFIFEKPEARIRSANRPYT